jgi:hypothetical protein
LAISMASASVLKRCNGATGPKVSPSRQPCRSSHRSAPSARRRCPPRAARSQPVTTFGALLQGVGVVRVPFSLDRSA